MKRASPRCLAPCVGASNVFDREFDLQQKYAEELLKYYIGGYQEDLRQRKQMNEYCDSFGKDSVHPFLLVGPDGCGKSSFVAAVAREKRTGDRLVYTQFAGITQNSKQLGSLLHNVTREIVEYFELDHGKYLARHENVLVEQFADVLEAASQSEGGELLLFIDGLSEIVLENGKAAGLGWVPRELPRNVRLVLTLSVLNQDLLSRFDVKDAEEATFLTEEDSAPAGFVSNSQYEREQNALASKVLKEVMMREWKPCLFESPGVTEIKPVILAYLESTWQQPGGSNSSGLENEFLNRAISSAPLPGSAASTPRASHCPLVLLDSQVAELVRKYEQVGNLGFLFELLSKLHLAARVKYDLVSLLRDCSSSRIVTMDSLATTCLNFFARGNYPIEMTIQRAWGEVKRSKLIQPNMDISNKRVLPSSREIQKRKEIRNALAEEFDCQGNNGTSQEEDEDEYPEDFEDDDEESTNAPSSVLSTSSLFNETPIYLLGGERVPPLDGILHKCLGYIVSARYGLTFREVGDALLEAIEVEQDEEVPQEEKKVSENSFEEWLLDETKPPSVVSESLTKPASAIPDDLREVLSSLLSFGYSMQVEDITAPLFYIPRNSHNLRLLLDASVLNNPEHAPTESRVRQIGLDIELVELQKQAEKEKQRQNVMVNSDSTEMVESLDVSEGLARSTIHFEVSSLPSRWRLVLIRMFENTKNNTSQRKAEEYPWLLEMNGRWSTLLETIVDIGMFTSLWNMASVGRKDLVRYWGILSSTTPTQICLEEIRGPGMNTISEDTFGGEENPVSQPVWPSIRVDPVEQYTKSVDRFHEQILPRGTRGASGLQPEVLQLSRRTAEVLNNLCEFFWMFGSTETLAPQYLHPPIAEEELVGVKIGLPHRDCKGESWALNLYDTNHAIQVLAAEREHMVSEQHLAQRQQAVSKAKTLGEKEKIMMLKRRRSRFISLILRQQNEHRVKKDVERAGEGLRYKGNVFGENFYSYQRWIWIHFPWMALYHASTIRILTNQERAKTIVVPKMGGKNSKRKKRLDTTIVVRKPSMHFFHLLKSDPHEAPKRKQSFLRSSLIKESSETVTSDLVELDTTAINSSSPLAGKKLKPCSSSYASPKGKIKANEELDMNAIFKGGILDEVALKKALVANLPAHMSLYPSSTHDGRVAQLRGMVSSLRHRFNVIRHEANEKDNLLASLLQQAYDRQSVDKFSAKVLQSGEDLINKLLDRLEKLQIEISKAEHANRYLSKVEGVCVDFPARESTHIVNIEKQLTDMRNDRMSLGKDLYEIRLFTKKASTVQKPKLLAELETRREMQSTVLKKLEVWRKNQEKAIQERQRRDFERLMIQEELKDTQFNLVSGSKMWATSHRQLLLREVIGHQVGAASSPKQQHESQILEEEDESGDEKQKERTLRKKFKKLRRLLKTDNVAKMIEAFKLKEQRVEQLNAQITERNKKRATLKARLETVKAIHRKLGNGVVAAPKPSSSIPREAKEAELVRKIQQKLQHIGQLCGLKNVNSKTFATDIMSKLSSFQALGDGRKTQQEEDLTRKSFLFGKKKNVVMPPRIDRKKRKKKKKF